MGRGAAANGNGRPVLPPGALSPITIYRQPPPLPRTRWAVVRGAIVWLLVALIVCAGSVAGGLYLYGRQVTEDLQAHTPDVKIAAKRLDVALPGPAGHRPRRRLRPPRRRGEGHEVPFRHDHARPRRPEDELDLAALLPARPLRAGRLPGRLHVQRADQQRLLGVRDEGDAGDGPQADGPAGQLPDHRQLPRLPPARRRPRRHLDGRRPPLLQRPQRPLRLRDDQSLPGLPEARRLPGARLRPLPAHRLRPLPSRPPAALRARVQGPDQIERRARSTCRRDQDDHEERRGGCRRRRGARLRDGAPLRALRLRAAAGPLLPVQDRGPRGDIRASTSSRRPRTSRRRSRSSRTPTSSRRRRRRRSRSARSGR